MGFCWLGAFRAAAMASEHPEESREEGDADATSCSPVILKDQEKEVAGKHKNGQQV